MASNTILTSSDKQIQYLVFFIFIIQAMLVFSILFTTKDVKGDESNVLYTVKRIVEDNSNLYQNINHPPFAITQYNPLYYIFADGLISALNILPTKNTFTIRVLLRLLSITGFILLIYFSSRLYTLLKKTDIKTREKQLFFLLLMSISVPWYYLTRPDVLVSLFYIISSYFLILHFKRETIKYIFWAGVCSAFALLAKQNGLLIFIIISSYLLLRLKFRSLFFYVASFGIGLSSSIFLYIALGYPTTYLYENLVLGISNGIDFWNAINEAISPFLLFFGFPFLLLVYGIFVHRKKIFKDFSLSYLVYFIFLSLIFGLFTCLKSGSAINYFNDTMIFSILLGFLLIGNFKRNLILVGLCFCLSLSSYHLLQYVPKYIYLSLNRKDHDALKLVNKIIDRELSENQYLYTNIRPIILDHPKKVILPQFDIAIVSMRNRNPSKKIYENIINKINYDNLKLLVIDHKTYSINLDMSKFEVIDQINTISIYKNLK